MARKLPHSRVNPQTVDEDDAYNLAVNRGEDLAHQILLGAEDQVIDQPADTYPNRGKNNSPK